MKYTPHEYQKTAFERILATPKIGLFLEMGLGKTVVTLTAIEQLMYSDFEISRVLVIAPKRVAEDTWSRETEKWDHLKHLTISKVLGAAAQRREALKKDADIYVVNRENVKWLADGLKDWPFDMVVIDELSSFKSRASERFKALRKVMPTVKRVVGLTGTPTPNGYLDLWSQIYLLDRGERLEKTIGAYRELYFTPGMRNGYTVYSWNLKPGADKTIQAKIADICVSMKAEDYLTMPERIDNIVNVTLTPIEMAKYKELEKQSIIDGTDIVALSAAAIGNKLLQIANGRVYDAEQNVIDIHSQKIEALAEILDVNSEPVLVFYNFKHDLDALQKAFPEGKILDTSEDIAAWNAGKTRLIFAHPASVGHGLNIQAGGHIIVWYGLTWSLELYEQANARLYRQGQNKAVIIHHLVAKGTIDEQVMRVLAAKGDTQAELMRAINERRSEWTSET